jgi:pantothenate kinase
MSQETHRSNIQAVVKLVKERRVRGRRTVIAVAGPPASGKTTLAEAVVQSLNRMGPDGGQASVLPMDGYHLDNEDLRQRGLLARKGAVETFDALGFSAALRSVVNNQSDLALPGFDRDRDCVVPDQIVIKQTTQIVVAEGNYLLLDREPWSSLQPFYDGTVFVKAALDVLEQRLLARWHDQDLSAQDAQDKVMTNDLPNAALVLDESLGADLVIEHAVHDALFGPDGGRPD